MNHPQRIAVVGSGIAGLASAWLLQREPSNEVTLFESDARLGGHANTVDVTLEGQTYPVDTGFLVFNDRTYPNLIALFKHLGVASVASEMTFAVSLKNPDLEWAGSNLFTLFGQKRNLLRKDFWAMLGDMLRFNRESCAWLEDNPGDELSLRDFLAQGRYAKSFSDWYLLPMAAAIWSCPTGQMLDMPLLTFVRFCQNHGLLQVFDRPMWRTVQGGSRNYVGKIAAQLDDVRLACPVTGIERFGDGLLVRHGQGAEAFDQVVMACHSDQSLRLLDEVATPMQRRVLAAVRYQPNRAVLHTDRRLLPRNQRLWSAWNYFAGHGEPGAQPVGVSYLINRLQPLPFQTPVVVTLNPVEEPDPATVLASFEYDHPIFDRQAIEAQAQLGQVQGERGIWLAGAWGGYGFHEDGLNSALRVASAMGVLAPWQQPAAVAQQAKAHA
ncbi:MAG: FAD-dependent oxidoreductase [Burkholderiaceae bacterium]